MRRSQIGRYISVPRAVLMSPRSMTSVCPKLSSSSVTVALAAGSSPETKTEDSAPSVAGSTMRSALRVLRVLTTRAAGKARWICSASESVSFTNSVGGIPWLKSRGLETSMTTLPSRLSAPARVSTSTEALPFVTTTTTSAAAAAAANVAGSTSGWSAAQPAKSSRARVASGSLVPIETW